jgi:release factor glutamine methyltransferase
MISYYEQELLLSHILKKSREYVLAHLDIKLTKRQLSKYRELTARRFKNEPLAYILGEKGFYGLNFKVSQDTLIPRPETEILVEEILKSKPKNSFILDVGTGSGNIAISLAKYIHGKNKFYGLDNSTKSIKVARSNSKRNGVGKKIKFINSDLLNYFLKNKIKLKNKEIVIAANLPYLSKKIYASLKPDVKKYEPRSALLSGDNGLNHYKKLFQQIKVLKSNCYSSRVTCYIEFSPEQKAKILRLVKQYFPESSIEFQKDLAQKWRVLIAKI